MDILICIAVAEVNVVGTLELDSGGLILVNELDGLVVIVADTVACRPLTGFEARLLAAELVLVADRIDVRSLLRRIEEGIAKLPPAGRGDDRPQAGGPCTCAGP